MRLLITTLIFALAGESTLADPVGKYAVHGTNPGDKSEYQGSVTVTRTGQTYHVVWKIGDGETVGIGVGGRLVGAQYEMGPASEDDTMLSVAYRSGATVGTALYSEDPKASGMAPGPMTGGSYEAATEIWTTATKKLKTISTDTREAAPRKSLSTPLPAQNSPRQ